MSGSREAGKLGSWEEIGGQKSEVGSQKAVGKGQRAKRESGQMVKGERLKAKGFFSGCLPLAYRPLPTSNDQWQMTNGKC